MGAGGHSRRAVPRREGGTRIAVRPRRRRVRTATAFAAAAVSDGEGLRRAANQLVEPLGQVARDRARLAVADHAVVDFHHGDDFGGGAGEEAFVGDVDVVLGERGFVRRRCPASRASSITALRVTPSRMPASSGGV